MPRSSTRSERPAAWAAALGLLGALLGSGCPFEPRDAPPPCTPGVDPGCRRPRIFEQPITPEIVRDNIVRALGGRGTDPPAVEPNYKDSLDEPFVYVPDAAANAVNPGCFAGDSWNKEREAQFMQTALTTVGTGVPDSIRISIPGYVNTGQLGDGEARYEVRYSVTLFWLGSTGQPDSSECYGGTAKWDLVGGLQLHWSLQKWEDVSPDSTGCPTGTYPHTFRGTLGILRALRGNC